MKSALLIILIVGSCSSWRQFQRVGGWEYTKPAYTDDCSETGRLIIEGKYQQKNLYMMNPECYCTDSTMKYTVTAVVINDSIVIPYDSLASSAFEIPLTQYGFQADDPIYIVVKHRAAQTPQLLNPEVR